MPTATRTIAFHAPFLGGRFYRHVRAGVYSVAYEHNIRILIMKGSLADMLQHQLASDHIDGWITVTSGEAAQPLVANGKPVVTISHQLSGASSVKPNNIQGALLATQHLINLGHQRIYFIGNLANADMQERYAGYCTALQEAGIVLDSSLVIATRDQMEVSGLEAGEAILAAPIRGTAAVVGNDYLAFGLMEILQHSQLRIPEDIAIVGFDDDPNAVTVKPSLTTIRQSYYELGRVAATQLLQELALPKQQSIIIETETQLIIRESCGAPGMQTAFSEPEQSPQETNLQLDIGEHSSTAIQMLAFEDMLNSVNRTTSRLVAVPDTSIRSLEWMQNEAMQWGVLGMWNTQSGKELTIAGAFPELQNAARVLPCAAFPPLAQIDASSDVITIAEVRTTQNQWGMIAFGTTYNDAISYIDWSDRWLELLGMRLDNCALFDVLDQERSTLQRSYERERALADTVRDLGCPIIPLGAGKLLIPLIGLIDSARAQLIIDTTLTAVSNQRTTQVLLDVSGVPLIDTHVAGVLLQLAQMVQLLGAQVGIVGVRPEIAQSIVGLGVDLRQIRSFASLEVALHS